jgi:hypothetical protein
MSKWAKGLYQVQNKEKYIGNKLPTYRSSWELKFCQFCDSHPSIIKWASENIAIPYFNPIKNRYANYFPDFMIQYIDQDGKEHVELIEIKPSSQTTFENAGRSKTNQAQVVVNSAKWEAAQEFCKRKGIRFKVINENQLFHTNKKRTPNKRKK